MTEKCEKGERECKNRGFFVNGVAHIYVGGGHGQSRIANVTFTDTYVAEHLLEFCWCFYPASPLCLFVEVSLRCPSVLFYVAHFHLVLSLP
jgi:hypothetical protein